MSIVISMPMEQTCCRMKFNTQMYLSMLLHGLGSSGDMRITQMDGYLLANGISYIVPHLSLYFLPDHDFVDRIRLENALTPYI